MTFEGFDAQMPIESTGFSPATPPEPDGGALIAALAGRVALRAEAGMLDLWAAGAGRQQRCDPRFRRPRSELRHDERLCLGAAQRQ